jgi:hypothetical protein
MRLIALLILLMPLLALAQRPDGLTTSEIAGGPAILGKPPKYPGYSPCTMVFENYTNTPLQISMVRLDGKLQKLYYVEAKGMVRFESFTNMHHIVVHQGYTAGPMFIPFADINVCKIHDAHFHATKKISPKMYVEPDDGYKDLKYKYKLSTPTYGKGKGPVVYFDEAHANRYRITDRFKPLATMLQKDGYDVRPYKINFTDKGLATGKILVMANAYGQQVNGWLVDSAQALTKDELSALKSWVENGGRLLLLADVLPFPSRVEQVAKAFGFEWLNGQVLDTSDKDIADVFSAELKMMGKHVILEGRNDNEIVDQVAVFNGSAIRIPAKAKPVLKYSDSFRVFYPQKPWEITPRTPGESADGLCLAATLDYGQGKVVVLGDIEMLCALKATNTGEKVGMNHKFAQQNARFALNMFHWLDGFIE